MARRRIKEFLVKDLIRGSIRDDGYFRRLDIIINYIGIEAHYGKSETGWELYNKYQVTSKRRAEACKKKFVHLIKSFEENGCLSKKYPLMISTNNFLHIRNGAHRLSCAIYFGNDKVYGYVKNNPLLTDIGSTLLLKRGFTVKEIEILERKKNQVLKMIGMTDE